MLSEQSLLALQQQLITVDGVYSPKRVNYWMVSFQLFMLEIKVFVAATVSRTKITLNWKHKEHSHTSVLSQS